MEIKHPCPMSLNRMDETENGFFCSTCNKEVIDFRNMSIEEIKASLATGGCGLFNTDQLTNQRTYKPIYRLAFTLLTCLSFIGFSVKPLKAQTTQTPNTNRNIPASVVKQQKHRGISGNQKAKPYRRKGIRLFRRKRIRGLRRTMGCPSF